MMLPQQKNLGAGTGCDTYANLPNIQKLRQTFGYQFAASRAAQIGEHQLSLYYWDSGGVSEKLPLLSKKQLKRFQKNYQQTDAIAYILERAKNERAVFINEAHHNSQHRNFSKRLLTGLCDLGYTHIGLEALWAKDTTINERGFPIQRSGIYTKDPEFANFVRLALELDFELFAYEASSGANGAKREREQAKNIKKIIDKNPNAKIFVHAGFGHISEQNTIKKEGKIMMAGYFRELTHINPLTIDQVDLSERSDRDYENPYYKAVTLNRSSVLIDKNKQSFRLPSAINHFDIQVLHPRTSYQNHRPNWKYTKKLSRKFIDEFLSPCSVTSGIAAVYNASELEHHPINQLIPIDMIVLQENKRKPLLLPKGEYVLEVCCGDKIITKNISITETK